MGMMLLLLAPILAPQSAAVMKFGPPISLGGGGKMSNTLSLYPSGFASGGFRFSDPVSEGVVFSVDGGATYHRAPFNMSVNRSWDSFVVYEAGTKDVWAHDFGTYHECIPGQELNGATFTNTSVTSQPTMTYRVEQGQLSETLGPPVSFGDLPEPPCGAGGNSGTDKAFVGMTTYAGGQLVLEDGTHLVTTMYPECAPGKSRNGGIHLFSSQKGDGYNFTFRSHVARQSDSKSFAAPAEGPNEHTLTLLPNGDILCVFRTEAGDGNGRYGPYYSTRSTDAGKSWSTAQPLKDKSGNYIGCARPHMVQLAGNVTLLAGGRMMMGRDYSRSFSIWMSTDGGLSWARADGSYHHNARAKETGAPLWPASCNRTGWRFEFTSGYIGLVRVGPSSAAVVYDLMLPPPPGPPTPPAPPAPPTPPGACKGRIVIHHTLGCYNYTSWVPSPAGTGPVLPTYQPKVEGSADLESCAAACYRAELSVAGILDGKHCFCGTPSNLAGTAGKVLSVPKVKCSGVPCEGNGKEKECGGVDTMLAYAFTCDALEEGAFPHMKVESEEEQNQLILKNALSHNPATSFSMRIDVNAA